MPTIEIYLKGWQDSRLFTDAVNDATHALHEDAMKVHLRGWRAYEAGDVVHHAITFDAEAIGLDGAEDNVILNACFDLFNVGDPFGDVTVRRYRNAGHRSLSVGDVVVIDGRAFTVASFGFTAVEGFEPTLAAR
jgi:hypothetical protein